MKLSRLLIVTLAAVAFSACGVSDPVGPRWDITPVLDRQVSAPADTLLVSPASADDENPPPNAPPAADGKEHGSGG